MDYPQQRTELFICSLWSSRRNYFANGPQAQQLGTSSACPLLDWDELVLCLGGVSSHWEKVEWGCRLPGFPFPWNAWTSDLGERLRKQRFCSPASTPPLGKQGIPTEITWVAQLQQSHWCHSSPFLFHCRGRARLQLKGEGLAPRSHSHCHSWSMQSLFPRVRCSCLWWRRHLWNAGWQRPWKGHVYSRGCDFFPKISECLGTQLLLFFHEDEVPKASSKSASKTPPSL